MHNDGTNFVKCRFTHFPSFFHSMLTTMVNVSHFGAGKTFLLHNFYVPAHTYFYAQGEVLLPATSTDDVKGMSSFNDLKTVEECAKFHEAYQQTGLFLWDCT